MLPSILISALIGAAAANSSGGWGLNARQAVPDDLAIEMALERHALAPNHASAIYGMSALSSALDGSPLQVSAVGWLRLDGIQIIEPARNRGSGERRYCGRVAGHDPVPGGRTLVALRPTLDAPAAGSPPGLVIASGEDEEVAVVQLLPGDVVQVTDGSNSRERWETIALTRGVQRLTVERRGRGAQVCYEPNIHLPPEWMPD